MSGNMMAIAYINNMGEYESPSCNQIAKDILEWTTIRHLWLSAAHIPGVHNVIADSESRKFKGPNKWMISNEVLKSFAAFGSNLRLVSLV